MKNIKNFYAKFPIAERTPISADGYHDLANAIVLQAVEDYRYSVSDDVILDRQYLDGKIDDDYYLEASGRVKSNIRALAKFFRGAWCDYLTNLDCQFLPRKLKDDTVEFIRLAEKAIADPRTEGIDTDVWERMTNEERKPFRRVFRCTTCGGRVSMAYGYIGWEWQRGIGRVNQYGWRVRCHSCDFRYTGKVRTVFSERSVKR